MELKMFETIKIIKKENIGTQDVYDIEIENNHHYILENGVISHNSGFVYASSIVLAMRKLKLKEDEDGNKTTTVQGIRAQVKCMKTRFNKPFEQVELKIPYETGMDAHSGLLDMFEAKGLLVKEGNKLRYTDLNGKEYKYFRKGITNEFLDLVMTEFHTQMDKLQAKVVFDLKAVKQLSEEENVISDTPEDFNGEE
jgi:hypothetical protein